MGPPGLALCAGRPSGVRLPGEPTLVPAPSPGAPARPGGAPAPIRTARVRPYQILVVDDSPEILGMTADLLTNMPGIAVAGRAASGSEALELAERLAPDLVLTDLTMPGMNGLE